MHFNNFSKKQLKVMSWWTDKSPYKDRDAIICDGAIRAGKTLPMSLSFVIWAMSSYDGYEFAICGKSVKACIRNVVRPLIRVINENLKSEGFSCKLNISSNELVVNYGSKSNTFYIFGGKDERSADLIQGVTLAGILFDEVALMPKSFVEQGKARCSVENSKVWYNCNPEEPSHWFYKEWILDADGENKHNSFHLHFNMEDNPSLSPKKISQYHRDHSGVFYDRMVLGKWVRAEGAIYPMFGKGHIYSGDIDEYIRGRISETNKRNVQMLYQDERTARYRSSQRNGRYFISIDYGTLNPFSAGLWCYIDGIAYRIAEFYHDGRRKREQYTDEQYYEKVCSLAGDKAIESIIVDPSAASFITCIYNHGKYSVVKADNAVLDGIRNTATALNNGWIMFHESCVDGIREMQGYCWDDKAVGEDRPLKENDHVCDEVRYLVQTILMHEKKWD